MARDQQQTDPAFVYQPAGLSCHHLHIFLADKQLLDDLGIFKLTVKPCGKCPLLFGAAIKKLQDHDVQGNGQPLLDLEAH